jgi:hypothetical protein
MLLFFDRLDEERVSNRRLENTEELEEEIVPSVVADRVA